MSVVVAGWTREHAAVLRVFCPEGKLNDFGEVLTVGDHVLRPAQSRGGGRAFRGTELEDVSWVLDRDRPPMGGPIAIVSGDVAAIDAVSVTMTAGPQGGWRRAASSARLESRTTTAGTPTGPRRVAWTVVRTSAPTATVARAGFGTHEEEDEILDGWLLTLVHEQVRQVDARSD